MICESIDVNDDIAKRSTDTIVLEVDTKPIGSGVTVSSYGTAYRNHCGFPVVTLSTPRGFADLNFLEYSDCRIVSVTSSGNIVTVLFRRNN